MHARIKIAAPEVVRTALVVLFVLTFVDQVQRTSAKPLPGSARAGALAADAEPYVLGDITKVDKDSIEIKPAEGAAVTVTLNANTIIKVDGFDADTTYIKIGMNVIAIGQPGKPATRVGANSPKQTSPGVFGALTAIGKGTITLQPPTGAGEVVAVDDNTIVTIDAKPAHLGDLKIGMHMIAHRMPGHPANSVMASK